MAGYGRTLYKLICVSTLGLLIVGLHFMTGFGSPKKRHHSGHVGRTLLQDDMVVCTMYYV